MEWNNYVYESVVFYCVYFAWQNGYQLYSLWLYKKNEKKSLEYHSIAFLTKTLIFCTNWFELSEGKNGFQIRIVSYAVNISLSQIFCRGQGNKVKDWKRMRMIITFNIAEGKQQYGDLPAACIQ